MRRWHIGLLAVLSVLCAPAHAVIRRVYPLSQILADADSVTVTQVGSRDRDAQSVVLRRVAVLKGPPGPAEYRVRLAGGDDHRERPLLAARLPRGAAVVLFGKSRRFLLGYAAGAWFRLAEPTKAHPARWQFVHLEPYLRRTYSGPAEELRTILIAALAGQAAPPAPNEAAAPGPVPPPQTRLTRRVRGQKRRRR